MPLPPRLLLSIAVTLSSRLFGGLTDRLAGRFAGRVAGRVASRLAGRVASRLAGRFAYRLGGRLGGRLIGNINIRRGSTQTYKPEPSLISGISLIFILFTLS